MDATHRDDHHHAGEQRAIPLESRSGDRPGRQKVREPDRWPDVDPVGANPDEGARYADQRTTWRFTCAYGHF